MERLQVNRLFLTTVLHSKKRAYSKLILNASIENIKALLECFINLKSSQALYKKIILKHKPFLRQITPTKVNTIPKVRKTLIKYYDSVIPILKKILNQIIDDSLVCIYSK